MNIKLPERLVPWPEPNHTLPVNDMFASLVCDPPLGQATVVPSEAESASKPVAAVTYSI